jgi:hypothetical protein
VFRTARIRSDLRWIQSDPNSDQKKLDLIRSEFGSKIIGSDPIRIRNELDSIRFESNSDKTDLVRIRSESKVKKMFRNVFLKIYLIKNVAKHFLFQFKRKKTVAKRFFNEFNKNRCEMVYLIKKNHFATVF